MDPGGQAQLHRKAFQRLALRTAARDQQMRPMVTRQHSHRADQHVMPLARDQRPGCADQHRPRRDAQPGTQVAAGPPVQPREVDAVVDHLGALRRDAVLEEVVQHLAGHADDEVSLMHEQRVAAAAQVVDVQVGEQRQPKRARNRQKPLHRRGAVGVQHPDRMAPRQHQAFPDQGGVGGRVEAGRSRVEVVREVRAVGLIPRTTAGLRHLGAVAPHHGADPGAIQVGQQIEQQCLAAPYPLLAEMGEQYRQGTRARAVRRVR